MNSHRHIEFDNLIEEPSFNENISRASWLSYLKNKSENQPLSLEVDEEMLSDDYPDTVRMLRFTGEMANPAHLAFITTSADILRASNSTAEDNRNNNSFPRNRLLTFSSTPASSIDLEWENELGMISNQYQSSHEDEAPISDSRPSTPLSNGNDLEWDFTSVDMDSQNLLLIDDR